MIVAPRFSCHLGSSWIKDQTQVSCTGRQIPSCWATREAPYIFFFNNFISCFLISVSSSLKLTFVRRVIPIYDLTICMCVCVFVIDLTGKETTRNDGKIWKISSLCSRLCSRVGWLFRVVIPPYCWKYCL